MITAIPTAWKQDNRTGTLANRDVRLYADFRQFEYPDLGTGSAQYTVAREDNLIDRGNCELEIAPMIFDETVPLLSNATFARSADFSHTGDYSYKATKTVAAGTAGVVYLHDNVTAGDMHGMVAGSAYTATAWVYIPTASGIQPSEIELIIGDSVSSASVAATTLDEWELLTVSRTLDDAASRGSVRFVMASAAANNEYFYVDDVKCTTHNVPGSHYLSGGYIENLLTLPDTFTIQIKFKPNFAYNTGSNQFVAAWRTGAVHFLIFYSQATDTFRIQWTDGGAAAVLDSAQYDDGSAQRNINQWITLTAAIDLTIGSTAGSSLWLDKTQDDTVWSANINAKTTVLNKQQIRADGNGNAGDFDIAFVRFWDSRILTDAEVQNDAKTVRDEEIYFSLDGHGTGRTRCNITAAAATNRIDHYDIYKGVTGKLNGTYGTNTLNLRLRNDDGAFSDDQNAAWDPASGVYNGTDAQNYLQKRFGLMLESWYSGDFDFLFVGRVTENGFRRQSKQPTISMVTCQAEDGVGDLDRSFEEYGRIFTDNMLTRENTLIDRGNCESKAPTSGATLNNGPPAMVGELANTLSNATFARDDDQTQVYHGRFAYKGTKTIAAGTAATVALSDSTGADSLRAKRIHGKSSCGSRPGQCLAANGC
jgi:hypothetical protein